MDSKLRNHSVDVHGSATVAHVKLLLANMSLVPAGLVPKACASKAKGALPQIARGKENDLAERPKNAMQNSNANAMSCCVS